MRALHSVEFLLSLFLRWRLRQAEAQPPLPASASAPASAPARNARGGTEEPESATATAFFFARKRPAFQHEVDKASVCFRGERGNARDVRTCLSPVAARRFSLTRSSLCIYALPTQGDYDCVSVLSEGREMVVHSCQMVRRRKQEDRLHATAPATLSRNTAHPSAQPTAQRRPALTSASPDRTRPYPYKPTRSTRTSAGCSSATCPSG